MSTPVHVVGDGNPAKVTKSGELVVAPLHYSETVFNILDAIDTAYHFYPPRPRQQFVITGVVVFADKDVSDASDTVIVIYEADSTTSTTVDKVLIQFGMGKLTSLPLLGLNSLVNKGKFVNAKTGDDDIHMSILGYYISEL